jgi:hypothetical protein
MRAAAFSSVINMTILILFAITPATATTNGVFELHCFPTS